MFKIGMFSKLNKISVKALRHYDDIGLLKPAYVDDFTGYRFYSASQLPRLHRILALKGIGFSLQEIKSALEQDTPATMVEILESKQQEIARALREEQEKLNRIEFYLDSIKQEAKNMEYNVLIKELPEVIVASMRKVIPNYEAFNTLYPEMGKQMEAQNLTCQTPEYCFTIYHDGEYKETDIDVEICEAVTEFGEDTETMKFKRIEKVETAASVMHKGPYSTIGKAYAALMNWIEQSGYQITGLPRESYIDGIWNKDNPEEWLTEVQIPVKKS
ncbi:MerR family transcriptional regulator [Dethiobacter alkaliphilus]|uniref:MerR family transcriptional regulator n=1 Tax=Dethiobacter alkaliphilus TaxID=427926 RepID=UPI002226D1AF|nr:MerR family transcriptional regulator [Dethiobacter alkaliphilus]MCW3489448.1 MerR family transcriptional regulator [Dethiobacter alkaliphilus]